jgi:hypothetical protein
MPHTAIDFKQDFQRAHESEKQEWSDSTCKDKHWIEGEIKKCNCGTMFIGNTNQKEKCFICLKK